MFLSYLGLVSFHNILYIEISIFAIVKAKINRADRKIFAVLDIKGQIVYNFRDRPNREGISLKKEKFKLKI